MIKRILICTLSVAVFTTAIAKAGTPPACPTGQDARILAQNILSVPGQGTDCDDNIGSYHTCDYQYGAMYDGACYVMGTYAKSFTSGGEANASKQAMQVASYNEYNSCTIPAPQQARKSYVTITRMDGNNAVVCHAHSVKRY